MKDQLNRFERHFQGTTSRELAVVDSINEALGPLKLLDRFINEYDWNRFWGNPLPEFRTCMNFVSNIVGTLLQDVEYIEHLRARSLRGDQ